MLEASVRSPHPVSISGDMSRWATARAFSWSTMPAHRQWPMFDVKESICRLSLSRPMAIQPRSSTQKSRLKAAFRSAAFLA